MPCQHRSSPPYSKNVQAPNCFLPIVNSTHLGSRFIQNGMVMYNLVSFQPQQTFDWSSEKKDTQSPKSLWNLFRFSTPFRVGGGLPDLLQDMRVYFDLAVQIFGFPVDFFVCLIDWASVVVKRNGHIANDVCFRRGLASFHPSDHDALIQVC